MASYIDRSLGDGEAVITRARFPWVYTFAAILWACTGIGLLIAIPMMIRKWTTEIGVTSHRFVEKRGLITLRTNEIALPNIEGVKVEQGVLGSLFGYGTVRIEGTGVDAVTTPNIADPVAFVRAIQTAKEHVASLRSV